uniref:Beta-conglycinin, alpha' chain n=1 Tax=Lygus hesperus TaxID=30085 RepID=A0A0A9XQ93_LYGHE
MNNFTLEAPDKEPTKVDVTERNYLKAKKDHTKKKNKELKESEVCPKCKISMQSDQHNNPVTMKTKPNKGRKGGRKGRSVKRNRRMSKDRHTKRRSSKPHRGALPKHSDTKYFIKSFFTGTSSETTRHTKSNDRSSRNLLIKPNTRRKKSTFTLPHSVTVGQAGLNFAKKKPDDEIDVRQLPGKVRSKNDVDTLMTKEMKMINKHVRAHEKHMNQTSAPMFHTCFKNILSHELET